MSGRPGPISPGRRALRLGRAVVLAFVLAAAIPTFNAGGATPAQAAPRLRAVIVGIDRYVDDAGREPDALQERELRHLEGAVNDALAMRDVLVNRYGFTAADVRLLVSPTTGSAAPETEHPTRAAILDSIDEHFADVGSGDVALFFFSGHGSQVRNSGERAEDGDEPDGYDETIVPADGMDIRDKELRARFNGVLDSGATLTVVLDSCHSGSAARGPADPEGSPKALLPVTQDIADGGDYGPRPGDRGALVLAAAAEAQRAWETRDEPRQGEFMRALLAALAASSSAEPIETTFRRVRALMDGAGLVQRPIMEATPERRRRDLLGRPAGTESAPMRVAVAEVSGTRVRLQGGVAIGLHPGTELEAVDASDVRLRVVETVGVVEAWAEPTRTDRLPRSGDLFTVTHWRMPREHATRFWVPPDAMPAAELAAAVQTAQTWAAGNAETFVADPATEVPTHVLVWRNGAWRLRAAAAPDLRVSESLRDALTSIETSLGDGRARVHIEMPPPVGLRQAVATALGRSRAELATELSEGVYRLDGRVTDTFGGAPMYAWLLPLSRRGRSLPPGPVHTDPDEGWMRSGGGLEALAAELAGEADRLVQIADWLTLQPPGDAEPFPYTLAFRNVDSGALVHAETVDRHGRTSGGVLRAGRRYEIVLVLRDPEMPAPRRPVPQRRVYAMSIGASGRACPLYPWVGCGGAGYEWNTPPPWVPRIGTPWTPMVRLWQPAELDRRARDPGFEMAVTISEPLGRERIVVISTTREIDRALLEPTRGSVRGEDRPDHWWIEHLTFRSCDGVSERCE